MEENNAMTIFMNTGDGDVYAGPTRELIIAEMQRDRADLDVAKAYEVSADTKVQSTDEDDMPTENFSTLGEEFGDCDEAMLVSSCNQ